MKNKQYAREKGQLEASVAELLQNFEERWGGQVDYVSVDRLTFLSGELAALTVKVDATFREPSAPAGEILPPSAPRPRLSVGTWNVFENEAWAATDVEVMGFKCVNDQMALQIEESSRSALAGLSPEATLFELQFNDGSSYFGQGSTHTDGETFEGKVYVRRNPSDLPPTVFELLESASKTR